MGIKNTYKVKNCVRCKEEKEHSLTALICRDCTSKYQREYNKINKEEHKVRNKQRYSKEYHRQFKLKKKYGLTDEEYNNMLKDQDFKCAICGLEYSEKYQRKFPIDHCHDTGQIRGILCMWCNIGLGYFSDNIMKLESAINYLKLKQNGNDKSTYLQS